MDSSLRMLREPDLGSAPHLAVANAARAQLRTGEEARGPLILLDLQLHVAALLRVVGGYQPPTWCWSAPGRNAGKVSLLTSTVLLAVL